MVRHIVTVTMWIMTLRRFLKRFAKTVCLEEEMAELAASEASVDPGPGVPDPQDPPEVPGQHHHHHHYLHRCQCRLHYRMSRWDNPDNVHLHWTVRATACIATFFKVKQRSLLYPYCFLYYVETISFNVLAFDRIIIICFAIIALFHNILHGWFSWTVTQIANLLTPGHLDLPGHLGGAGALLPGDHDLLGAGLRAALDPRILLLCLDLPRPPSLHGHQVDPASLTSSLTFYHFVLQEAQAAPDALVRGLDSGPHPDLGAAPDLLDSSSLLALPRLWRRSPAHIRPLSLPVPLAAVDFWGETWYKIFWFIFFNCTVDCSSRNSHYLEREEEAAGHRSQHVFSSWQPRVKIIFKLNSSSVIFYFRNFVCSPPPSYQEVYAAERDQPPTYEDVVKQDEDQQNVQNQDDQDGQIEPQLEENDPSPDDIPMIDNLEQENHINQNGHKNEEESENPYVENN